MNYSRYARLLLVLQVRRHHEPDDAVVRQTDVGHERKIVSPTCPRDAVVAVDKSLCRSSSQLLETEMALTSSVHSADGADSAA